MWVGYAHAQFNASAREKRAQQARGAHTPPKCVKASGARSLYLNRHHLEGGIPPLFSVHCGPEGPAAGAKRLQAAEGREGERSETVVPEATH